jgi:hypothetical protein
MYAMASLGYAGDQLSMVARGAERAIACAECVLDVGGVVVEVDDWMNGTGLCEMID